MQAGDKRLVEKMQEDGSIGSRVLVVEASADSKVRNIARAAESVATEVRRQYMRGYDLCHVEIKAILKRNDAFDDGPEMDSFTEALMGLVSNEAEPRLAESAKVAND